MTVTEHISLSIFPFLPFLVIYSIKEKSIPPTVSKNTILAIFCFILGLVMIFYSMYWFQQCNPCVLPYLNPHLGKDLAFIISFIVCDMSYNDAFGSGCWILIANVSWRI